MNKPFFSIILPTYNRLYSLKRFILPSLNAQNFNDFELVVVDDGSTDGTREYFNSKLFDLEFPRLVSKLKYLNNEKNLGSPASRNLAIKNSSAEWIFMVEDDIEIEESDFLERAKLFVKEFEHEYKIISPRRIERRRYDYDDLFAGFCKIGNLSKEIYLNTAYKMREYNSFQTHACSFIHKDVFTLSNYPDLAGMAFREESEFYAQAINKGIKIVYLGDDLSIVHRTDKSKTGGQRGKHKTFIKRNLECIFYHFTYLKRNYDYPKIRIFFFIFEFISTRVSYYLKLTFVKKILVRISL